MADRFAKDVDAAIKTAKDIKIRLLRFENAASALKQHSWDESKFLLQNIR